MPHNWSAFEQSALLGLLCRSIHLSGLSEGTEEADSAAGKKRKRQPNSRADAVGRQHAHADVATALNKALNSGDYKADIPMAEVSKMIDQLLGEKKAAKLFMERQKAGRVTRMMRKVWERGVPFDGSLKEWEGGRKEEEARKRERLGVREVLPGGQLERRATTEAGDAWGQAVVIATNVRSVAESGWDTIDNIITAPTGSTSAWGAGDASEAVESNSRATAEVSGPAGLVSADGWGAADKSIAVVNSSEWGAGGTTAATITRPIIPTAVVVSENGWRAEAAVGVVESSSRATIGISTSAAVGSSDNWGGVRTETTVVKNSDWGANTVTISTVIPPAMASTEDAVPGPFSAAEWDFSSPPVVPMGSHLSARVSVNTEDPSASVSTSAWDTEPPSALNTASTTALTWGGSNSPQGRLSPAAAGWGESTVTTAKRNASDWSDASAIQVTTGTGIATLSTSGKSAGFTAVGRVNSENPFDVFSHPRSINSKINVVLPAIAEYLTEAKDPSQTFESQAPVTKMALESSDQAILHPSTPTPVVVDGINPQRLAMLAASAEMEVDVADEDETEDGGNLGKKRLRGKGTKDRAVSDSFAGAKGSNAMPLAFNRLEASKGVAGGGLHEKGEAMDVSGKASDVSPTSDCDRGHQETIRANLQSRSG